MTRKRRDSVPPSAAYVAPSSRAIVSARHALWCECRCNTDALGNTPSGAATCSSPRKMISSDDITSFQARASTRTTRSRPVQFELSGRACQNSETVGSPRRCGLLPPPHSTSTPWPEADVRGAMNSRAPGGCLMILEASAPGFWWTPAATHALSSPNETRRS